MYECPNCGGNLKFDIPSQQLACAFCGTHKSPYEIKKETDATEQEYFEATIFTCPQCGGEILSADNEATAFCSFCGASTILSSRISKEKRPQYIIPFKKTKEDCKAAYAKKMRKAFFVPKELKDPQYIDGFRGIYMPYWSYQLVQNGDVKLKGSKTHRQGDYVITRHFDLTGDLDAYYLGYARDASSSFYDNISEALAPYDVKEMVNFEPTFLSGFYADTADVGQEIYLDDVTELANKSSYHKICEEKTFKAYNVKSAENEGNLKKRINTTCRKADNTMYPVWFLSYRNGDRVAYAAVNGQNGKIVADMPIDPKRYICSSLLLAIPIFLLLNLFFTFRPVVLLGLSCFLVLISAIIYAVELNAIYRKETYADDEGVSLKRGNENVEGETGGEKKKKEKAAFSITKLRPNDWAVATVLVFTFGPLAVVLLGTILWPVIVIGTIICGVIGIKNRRKIEDIKKTPGFIISMVTSVIAVLIRIVNPVADVYYYVGAMLALLAVLFNLIDIIGNYNRLAMRRLPQFDKKGGDDRA